MNGYLTRILRAGLACAALLHGPLTQAADGSERIEQFLKTVQSFEANFTQVLSDKSGRVLDESTGRLALQRPNRFRWDYEAPSEQVIVADGTRIWLFDPELEQVTVRKLDETLSATPAMLLSGEGSLRDNFKVLGSRQQGGLEWITLEPVRPDTDFKSVRLAFAGAELRRMELADKLNQLTTLEFSDVESNAPLDPKLFTFRVPPGADVIGAAGKE